MGASKGNLSVKILGLAVLLVVANCAVGPTKTSKSTGADAIEPSLPPATGAIEPASPPKLRVLGPGSTPSESTISGENDGAASLLPFDCGGQCFVQRVWFVTDRAVTSSTQPDNFFGAGRGSLQYGTCVVTIPTDHITGELDSPSIWKLEFHRDPRKHIVLANVTTQTPEDFRVSVDANLEGSAKKAAIIFVHGFNVTFAEAARRTAQLAYDMNFRGAGSRGAAIFYSWPSQGGLIPYSTDENNAEWTEGDLSKFLVDFLKTFKAERIYLIAHSMGSRPTLRALQQLVTDHPELVGRVTGFVLAAPDFDADIFRNQIAPAFGAAGLSGTLYVSSKDMALQASERLHGFPRLGDVAAGPVVVPELDTIDATLLDDGDFLGHGYFASKLLEDLYTLFTAGTSPQDRFGIEARHAPTGDYWRFRE